MGVDGWVFGSCGVDADMVRSGCTIVRLDAG